MNIKGLDYNTQRSKLIFPEYGREIHDMVAFCIELPTKAERQRCAETIITIMDRINDQNRSNSDHIQKLWDHLAMMSEFKLDIDYPYDVSQANQIAKKPAPMKYPVTKNPVRHYGKMMFELFEKLKTLEPGEEQDALVTAVANQMKRCLVQWGHGSADDERVASDLAKFTDGKIQLDLNHFKFERISTKENTIHRNNNKKKR